MALTNPPDPSNSTPSTLERIKEVVNGFTPWSDTPGHGEAEAAFQKAMAETGDEGVAYDAYNAYRALSAQQAEAALERIWRIIYDETEASDGTPTS